LRRRISCWAEINDLSLLTAHGFKDLDHIHNKFTVW
jgi:hypothetical protein